MGLTLAAESAMAAVKRSESHIDTRVLLLFGVFGADSERKHFY